MATVIDALLVTLGLDSSGYKTGADQVAKEQAKLEKLLKKDSKEREQIDKKASDAQRKRAEAFEKQGKAAAHTFGKIREHALGLIAVLAGGVGMAEFGKEVIGQSANLGRLSHNLGIHIKTLQAWEYANKAVGGSASQMSTAIESVTNSVAAYQHNGIATPQMMAMLKYGIGAHKTGLGQIQAASAYLSSLYKSGPEGRVIAWTRAQEMGLEGIFNLIKRQNRMKRLLAEGYKIAPVDRGLANQAEAMQHWWADFSTKIRGVATRIFVAFLPALDALQAKMMQWANWLIANKSQIIGWVEDFTAALVKFGHMLNSAAQAVGGWRNVLIGLAALKVLSIVSPLLSLAGALVKVGGGLAAVRAGGAALSVLARVATVAGVGATAMLHSQSLNKGEHAALSSAESRALIMARLQAAGLSKKDAAAVAGNLKAESNFNPTAVGDFGEAYGIAQWHPDRQAQYKKLFGVPMQSGTPAEQLKRQTEFILWELHHQYRGALTKMTAATTTYQKSAIFTKDYESPANFAQQIPLRARYAQEYENDPTVTMLKRSPATSSRIGAQSSAPVRTATVIHHTNTAEAHVGSVVINTTTQDPQRHGRMVVDAINKYINPDPLNSAFI